jgi:hypothetical protein
MSSSFDKRTFERLETVFSNALVSYGSAYKGEQPAYEITVWIQGDSEGVDHYILRLDRDAAKELIRMVTRQLRTNYPGV